MTLRLAQATNAFMPIVGGAPLTADQQQAITQVVQSAGSLNQFHFGLPVKTGLEEILTGGVGQKVPFHQKMALATLAARLGAQEMAALQEQRSSDANQSAQQAIDRLHDKISDTQWKTSAPEEGFWAMMEDPRNGFDPIRIGGPDQAGGTTEIAFFGEPKDLGEPWQSLVKDHWERGVGLVTFRNKETGTYGMIFVSTLGKVKWSKLNPGEPVWQASGGTMVQPVTKYGFEKFLKLVMHKAIAMGPKWWAADRTHLALGRGADGITGLGGSKGLLLFSSQAQREKSLRVYAQVLRLLGTTLTGCDEGLNGADAIFLAKLAPLAIYGNQHSEYGGFNPTMYTADGVFAALKQIAKSLFGGELPRTFMQGYGGIGSRLTGHLMKAGFPLAGVSEVYLPSLYEAHQAGAAPIFLDTSDPSLSRFQGVAFDGLGAILDQATLSGGIELFSSNASPGAITFEIAEQLIRMGVVAVAGAANNPFQYGPDGTPDAIALILHLAGIYAGVDYIDNRPGAFFVSSGTVNLAESDHERAIEDTATTTVEQLRWREEGKVPQYEAARQAAEYAQARENQGLLLRRPT